MLVLHCYNRVISTFNLKEKRFNFAYDYRAVNQIKLTPLHFGLWKVRNIMIEAT